MLEVGLKHTSELIVGDAVTAIQMGSGDMPVLATPAMMALMETVLYTAEIELRPTIGGTIGRKFDPETGTGFWEFRD